MTYPMASVARLLASVKIRFWCLPLLLVALLAVGHSWLTRVSAQQAVVAVSAASYETTLAPDSIAAAFGVNLATATAVGTDTDLNTPGVQLPTTLGGTRVEVAGRLAGLFFVSSGQINFLVPADVPTGAQALRVSTNNGGSSAVLNGTVTINATAPAIFTANASGSGAPSALVLRVGADGRQAYEPTVVFDNAQQRQVSTPINLGPEGEQVFLVLFATGVRRAADPNRDGNVNESIHVALAGEDNTPPYVGVAPGLVGLDQINLLLPRTLIGRGRVTLSLASVGLSAGGPSSNIVEIDIAGATGTNPPTVSGFGAATALAGQVFTIQGNGFASVTEQNTVRIGGLEAPVINATAGQLSALVPFGVIGDVVTVRTNTGETRSSSPLGIRTSVSGVVETTGRQPLADVSVQLISLASGARVTTRTGANGTFVAADVPTGPLFLRVQGSSISAQPALETISLPVTAANNRDNSYLQTIFLQPVTGVSAQVGGNGFSGTDAETITLTLPTFAEEAEQLPTRLQTGNVVFELPANAAVRFPDGATSGAITLTQVASSRVPASFPAGVFSSTVVQLSPFGTRFTPGGKLTMPNTEGFTSGSVVSLYRFDQDEESRTLGHFVVVGEARVSADGARIETETNAVNLGGYYFASRVLPTTTVTGRVLDANRTPLRRALVCVRGQHTLTDGNGGFILRNVPARSSEDLLTIEVSFLRATGRVDRTARGSVIPVVSGLTSVRPEIVMPAADSNQPPVIYAPEAALIPTGETTNFSILAGDPDSDQPVTLTVSGAGFASVAKTDASVRSYNLRLAPTTTGEFTLTLTATDARGARTTATLRVTVIQPNRAPEVIDQLVTTDEDTAKTFTLNGTDPDRNPLTWTVLTQPTKGKLTGTPPSLTYTPDANYFGRDSFTFKTNDGQLDSKTATLFIQVDAVNDAPVLTVPPPQTVKEGQLLTFVVSATDVENDTLSFSAPSLPTGANFVNGDRRFSWTPNFGQAGKYTVTLAVFDNGTPAKSDVRSVEITVTNTNRAPVANPQEATADEDVPKVITLTGSDPDNSALTYLIVTPPMKGTLTGQPPNVVYTPNLDFNGADSFTFKVNDGETDSPPATVRVTVRPVNDAPVTRGDSITGSEDTPKTITLVGTDVDGNPLTFAIVTPPTKGKLTGIAPNVTYTPNLDFNGTDSFTFKANDGTVDSNVSTVNITVTPVNDAPIARDRRYTTDEDTLVVAALDALDAESDPITYSVVAQPKNGNLSGTAPSLIYTPKPNFNGTDSFTYSASDGKLAGNIATITVVVNPVNDAPVAEGLNVATDEDAPVNLKLTATDIDGDTLQYVIVAAPAKGKLSGTAPNLTYTPNLNENGADTFTFKVNDGKTDSNLAFVNVTIRPVNDAPRARPQTVEVNEDETKAFVLDAVDFDGDKLTFTIVTPPTKGRLEGAAPNLAFVPTRDANGLDSFTYRVSDGTVTSDLIRVTIQINGINDPPTFLVPGPQTVAENQLLTFTIAAEDDDPANLKFTAPSLPTGASFIEAQRLFSWTPNFEQAGTYTVGFNLADNGTPPFNVYREVTITVTNTNRAPRANALTLNTNEDTPVAVTLAGADDDRDALTFMVVTPPSRGTLSGTGPNLIYTPNANANGADSFTYKANDGKTDSSFATVNLNVIAVNDAPVLNVPDAQFLNEGERLAFTLTFGDPDAGQTHTFSATGLPSGAQLNPQTGAFVWTPTNKQAGSYKIDFRVTDNGSPVLSDGKMVMVTVTNPAPVARPMSVILDEDTARAFTLDVSDADNDALTYVIINAPQHGALSGTAPNLTYTPALNYHGADQFTFKANDGVADSNTVTVSLTINSINDAPMLVVPGAQTGNENQLLTFVVAASDPDTGQTVTLALTNPPEGAVFERQTGTLRWTPSFTQAGSYTLNFTATDNGSPVRSDSKSVTVTINNVNRAPVANPNSVTTEEDTARNFVITGSDPDGDAITYTILTPPRNGALSGTAPNLTYTPNANFNGADSFTFRVSDASLESAFATVDITVTSTNDAPVLTVPPAQTGNENQLLSFTISGADLDGPTPLRYSATNLPSGASFDEPSRTFTWTPNFTQAGDYTVMFTMADGAVPPRTDSKTVAIKINNVNRAPVADAKSVMTDEDVAVTITLTGSDPDGQTVTFALGAQPTNGALTGTAPNVTYTPRKDFVGTDAFTYRTSDGSLDSPLATVTITVKNVNDAPVATPQSIAVDEDTAKSVVLTGTDADGDQLTFMVTAAPTRGRLTGTPPNLTYTPNTNFTGTDSFTFKANDGNADSNTGTITLSVGGVNDPPTATAQSVTTDEDVAKAITLTGVDVDGDALSFVIVMLPTRGTLNGTLPNVTYTPNANYFGTDSFTFKANDGALDSTPATVSLTINSVNDAPTLFVPDPQTGNEGTTITFTLTATDPDQGAVLTFSSDNLPSGATINPQTGTFSWMPTFDQAGSINVRFTVTDEGGLSQTKAATVIVRDVPRGLIADAQSVTTDEDITKAITLTGSDPEGGALTFVIVSPPTRGMLTGTPPNVMYAPNANVNGGDSFTFKVTAGGRESAPATVSITVNAINDAPTITAPDTRTANEGELISFVVSASDVDAGQTVTLTSGALPSGATFNAATGAFAWTPSFQQSGTFPISFTATDNGSPQQAASKTVTITVNDLNRAPIADSKSATTNEDTGVAVTLTGSDPENDPLTFSIVALPAHGTLSGTAPNLTYTPSLNYFGADSFSYKVNDGRLDSVNALISINVNPLPDAPALTVPGTITVSPNQLVSFQVSAVDPDGNQPLTFSASNLPSGANFDPSSRTFTWTPTALGEVTVTFRVQDDSNPPLADTKTVTITVTNTANRPPVCVPQEVTTDEDTPKGIVLSCSDPDRDQITISVVQGPMHGLLSGNIGPDITYSPSANYSGADNFTFRANDGKVNGDPATITLNVTPVCDAPALSVPNAQTAVPGQLLTFVVTASDVDSAFLTLTAADLPQGATFTPNQNGTSGTFAWTPSPTFPAGALTVTFTVTDNCTPTQLSDQKGVRITVGQSDGWTQTNGPEGGKITALVLNGSTVFAGTQGGGVFRSTDGGVNWTRASNGLLSPDITSLVFRDNALYAGTAGEGVFRSTDNGDNWTEFSELLTEGFVFAMTSTPTHLYAVVSSTAITPPKVRRSLFNNSGWVDYDNNFPAGNDITDLQIVGSEIYASTLVDGVFVSSVNSANWAAFNTNFPPASLGAQAKARRLNKPFGGKFALRAPTEVGVSVYALASNGTTLYAATDGGVYTSPVGTANWTTANAGIDGATVVTAIEVINGNLYARAEIGDGIGASNTFNVIRSGLSPISWSNVNTGLTNRAVNVFAGNASFVLAGTTGSGVARSTNGGTSWQDSNAGLRAAIVNTLTVNGTRLLAGTEGAGIFASSNDGQTWTQLNIGLEALFPLTVTRIIQSGPNGTTLYAATLRRGVKRSTDNGATWADYSTGLPEGVRILDLLLVGNLLFAAADDFGTYLTPTASTSWNRIESLSTASSTGLYRNATNVFVGTNSGSLFRGTLAGTGFVPVGSGLPNGDGGPVSSFAEIGAAFFVGVDGDGVFRSPDNGSNFTSESVGLTQRTVTGLQVRNTTLYAATFGGGVFYTTDNGENWTQIINNLTNLRLRTLVIKDGKLFAGTEGGGVFSRPVQE